MRTSGSFSPSTDRSMLLTCTSLRMPLGNRGRIGRSVNRAAKYILKVSVKLL